MADLVARYGADDVRELMVAMMDYSERLTRHCLAELPDGEATFTDWIDDDQIDAGVPIKLVCTVRKHGDTMEVDWTGSAPQVKGAINNTWSYTAADELHRGEVGAVDQHAEQRRRVPADQGHRAARHDHQRQAARRLRRARTDRLPRRRLLLRCAGAAVSRPGVSRPRTAATPA